MYIVLFSLRWGRDIYCVTRLLKGSPEVRSGSTGSGKAITLATLCHTWYHTLRGLPINASGPRCTHQTTICLSGRSSYKVLAFGRSSRDVEMVCLQKELVMLDNAFRTHTR